MVINRKAQAAMEFLMTYGWAILVVLVVIGALAYFGVLNPETLLPERCELQQGLYCKDHQIKAGIDAAGTAGRINLNLQNGMGTGILILGVVASSTDPVATCNITSLQAESWGGKAGRHI